MQMKKGLHAAALIFFFPFSYPRFAVDIDIFLSKQSEQNLKKKKPFLL